MDERPSWRRGMMHTTVRTASGKEGAKHVIVFGMIAVIFGFTKLPGLISKSPKSVVENV